MTEPIWRPTDADIEATNVASFAREVGLDSHEELWAWSVANRVDFWSAVVRRLGVALPTDPAAVFEADSAKGRGRWWPDARLNIVAPCFQRPRDDVAVVHRRAGELRTVTYGELEAMIESCSRHFPEGESVGIVAPMSLEAVVAYLAILRAGGIVVSIAESFSAEEIGRRLRIGEATTVVTQDVIGRRGRTLALYERVVEAGAESAIVIRGGDGDGVTLRPADVEWTDVLAGGSGGSGESRGGPSPTGRAADLMHVLFSSGTTGEPKAVPWTHLTPIKSAMDAHLHMDVGPGDVVCWPTSLGWMMGPWVIFASLLNGATIALFDDAPADRAFGDFVRDAGVTLLGVVPSLVSGWRSTRCMEGVDWSGVRRFASTGEVSNPEDMRYLSGLAGGRPVIEYIGGTEIGGGYMASTLTVPCWPSEFTTPAYGMDVVIVDGDGEPSDEGELFLLPSSVGLSNELLNADHEETYYGAVPVEGARRHGDYFTKTTRGTYRALGRVDDTMNLGGIKVASAEIERAVLGVGLVREAAAVSRVAAESGGPEGLALYLVVDAQAPAEVEWRVLCQEAISSGLNPLFRVAAVTIVPELPRTASNKVRRRDLREPGATDRSGRG